MQSMSNTDGIYCAVGQLIALLHEVDQDRVADILDHRLNRVAWTSGSELLEEVRNILEDGEHLQNVTCTPQLAERVAAIVEMIDEHLGR